MSTDFRLSSKLHSKQWMASILWPHPPSLPSFPWLFCFVTIHGVSLILSVLFTLVSLYSLKTQITMYRSLQC